MKIKHIFYGFIFILLLTTGCSNGLDGKVKEDEFPPTMTGMIHVNDREYEMKAGNYRWERKKGLSTEVVQTDAASPNQLAANLRAVTVDPNTDIQIEVDDGPELSVFLWNENGMEKEVKKSENLLTAPAAPGRYIYEVLAKWANGEVSYTFVVEVK